MREYIQCFLLLVLRCMTFPLGFIGRLYYWIDCLVAAEFHFFMNPKSVLWKQKTFGFVIYRTRGMPTPEVQQVQPAPVKEENKSLYQKGIDEITREEDGKMMDYLKKSSNTGSPWCQSNLQKIAQQMANLEPCYHHTVTTTTTKVPKKRKYKKKTKTKTTKRRKR